MKNFISVALGILLFISAAAAQGNGNNVVVVANEATTGLSNTGANIAQVADINTNLMGNDILANQIASLMIEDGNILGQSDGKTNVIQVANLMLNDTGSTNVDSQFVALDQDDNDLTIGNITQLTVLKADDIGNENSIDQSSSSSAGNFFGFVEPNSLTNSDLKQTSILDASVNGSNNNAVQSTDQFITDNTLTNSMLYEQADINANILGNENNLDLSSQGVFQNVDSNILTNSSASQLIYLDEQSSGNLNDVSQLARPFFFDNILTSSTAIQGIDVEASTSGNENTIDQNVDLVSQDNSAVGGNIAQMVEIKTNS